MPDLPALDAAEQRVLGTLLEKEITVPATYPLSLNGLRSGCNQTSSREPVTDYDEAELSAVCLRLQERRLIRLVREHGGRTVKYAQRLSETMGLDGPERSLLTVLLLRGAQSAGELKTRTERLHPFADRGEVESCLAAMAVADPPLVRELPRLPGQHDPRWIHLLGPVDLPVGAEPAVDVLVDGPDARDAKVLAAYAEVAVDYSVHDDAFGDWLLGRLVGLAEGGPMADVGCGVGRETSQLKSLGAKIIGFDLSPAMVERARAQHPGVRFEVADLRHLPKPDGGWAVIVAHDALVHLAATELPDAVASLAARLRPGGWLSLSLPTGRGVRHVDDWFGHSVDLVFVNHEPDAVRAAVRSAGLELTEWYLRGGADTEQRLHVLARQPGGLS